MIYLGENKVNKIGNGKRVYVGSNLIYQYVTNGAEPSEISLPNVPFLINYNAKQYVDGIMPNADGATFDNKCIINNTSLITNNGDNLYFRYGDCYYQKLFLTASDNPFNRSGNDPLTIIAKVKGSSGVQKHLLVNRGIDYNYMLRIGADNIWLHTLNSSQTTAVNVPMDFSQPNIFAIRCKSDGNGYAQNYTTNTIGDTKQTRWGGLSNAINLFYGNIAFERFDNCSFYWIYVSNEELTDEQIQQVINYNENL